MYEGAPGDSKLIARINRYAIYPNLYRFMGPSATDADIVLPVSGVPELLAAVEEVLEMGRVGKFSENKSKGRKSLRKGKYIDVPWLGYLMPLYL